MAFKPVPDSPVEHLVAEYRTRLVVDRGLDAATVLRYENLARRLLGQQRARSWRPGRVVRGSFFRLARVSCSS
ncbi:MAG: hypothetical protein ACRDT2_01125 [Natronosporangium sp.]